MRKAIYLLSMLAFAAVAGCAPTKPPEVTVKPSPGTAGVILSMRPVYSQATEEPLRAALLAEGGAPDDGHNKLVEFIVRVDDGATLSIIQTNKLGFQKGDRVVIMHDGRAILARPG